jgi:hypothetical protein
MPFDAVTSRIVGNTAIFYKNNPKNQLLDCLTVTVWSPTEIVPVRVTVGFIVTRKVTVELPVRVSAQSTLIHFELLFTK